MTAYYVVVVQPQLMPMRHAGCACGVGIPVLKLEGARASAVHAAVQAGRVLSVLHFTAVK